MYRNKKNVLIISMIAAVLVMIIGFAAFQTRLTIKGTGGITSVWGIEITDIQYTATGGAHNLSTPTYSGTNATLNTGLRKPGDKMVYTIKVENTGAVDAIIQDVNIDVSGSPVIIYSINGLEKETRLAKQSSKTFTLSVEFDSLATSIPSNATKEIIINIMAIQDDGQTLNPSSPSIDQELLLAKRILSDNTAQSDENIDFNSSGNEKGLYYTNVNTEDNKTTYYFRGLVENNYVQLGTYDKTIVYGTSSGMAFNSVEECRSMGLDFSCDTPLTVAGEPILWRIVRINEDGSVRIITDNPIGKSAFNNKDDDNAYVGYMYGTPGSNTYAKTHANINESEIKKYLDNWYTANLGGYGNITSNEAGFCNDRSVAPSANTWSSSDTALGYGKNSTIYGSYSRNAWTMDTISPQFKCPQTNDLFTMNTSSNGNKKLTQPIGLITFDEVIFAGGSDVGGGFSYIHGLGVMFWQMSPYSFGGQVYTNQVMGNSGMDASGFVRPVINLKADLEYTLEGTGDAGTATNPYIIKTN